MTLGVWPFDGYDLFYREDGISRLTGLTFDTLEDALYAARAFNWFLRQA